MAHSTTKIDGSLPFSVARLAAVTGNSMHDVRYQCSDTRPFFKFIAGSVAYYTTLHPRHAIAAKSVQVYSAGTVTDGGIQYVSMNVIGSGTQTGSTLSYGGGTYTCDNYAHEHVRLFRINIWAKYKPIPVNKLGDLTEDERSMMFWGLKADEDEWEAERPGTLGGGSMAGFHYEPPVYDGFLRITDFAGYDALAECPIKDIRPVFGDKVNLRNFVGTFSSDDIISRSDKVEIQLSQLGMGLSGPTVFLGYLFHPVSDDTWERSFFHTFNITADEAMASEGTQASNFMLSEAPWEDGEEIEVFPIAVEGAEDMLYGSLTARLYSIFCMSRGVSPRGYAKFTALAGYIDTTPYWFYSGSDGQTALVDPGVTEPGPNFYIQYALNGTTYRFSNCSIVIHIQYQFGEGEEENTYFSVSYAAAGTKIGESPVTNVTGTPQRIEMSQTIASVNYSISQADLRDNQGDVLVSAQLNVWSKLPEGGYTLLRRKGLVASYLGLESPAARGYMTIEKKNDEVPIFDHSNVHV